jgi:hypothetical protein
VDTVDDMQFNLGILILEVAEALKHLYSVDAKAGQRTRRIMQTVLLDALPSDQQIDSLHPAAAKDTQ